MLFAVFLVMWCLSSHFTRAKRFHDVSRALCSGKANRDGLGKPKGYIDGQIKYMLEVQTKSGLPDTKTKPFIVLGIESSCDDTGVAVVRSDGVVLSNIVYSQYGIHEKFGGVVPSLAMEAHKTNIELALKDAISKAGLNSIDEVDAIAVTKGPGLEICLRVGLRKAQALAHEYNKPFVTVHHLEAHCLIARLAGMKIQNEEDKDDSSLQNSNKEDMFPHFTPKISYPFLALLASGGHTSILICKGLGEYEMLGGTLDDALGEAFDKAARLIGLKLDVSGGAAVEAMALKGNPNAYSIKVPMRDKINCDFSYAGLKNSFRMSVMKAREDVGISDYESTNAPAGQMEAAPPPVVLPDNTAADLCATFQNVAFSHVEDRIQRALEYVEDQNIDISALVVVGGVAANKNLRTRLLKMVEKKNSNGRGAGPIDLIFPPVSLCTDNGVMAAWAGIEKLVLGISDPIEEQEAVARWPLGSQIMNPVFTKRDKEKRNKGGPE